MKTIKSILIVAAIMFTSTLSYSQIKTKNTVSSGKTNTSKAKTIHLTKADFLTKVANYENNPNEWKYLGDKPAIIDFYADWCGPCRTLAPTLEELAQEYDGEIYIYKIDTESEKELAALFGIRSLPSLLFIPQSGQPQMSMGLLPKGKLKEAINEVLLQKK